MRKAFLTLTGLGVLLLGSLGIAAYLHEPLHQQQAFVFGTLVEISIYGESKSRATELSNHILQDFQQLHERLHPWKPGSDGQPSELMQLNTALAQGKSFTASKELAGILAHAQQLSINSDGLFNPAIGHLIAAWGFHRDDLTPVTMDPANIAALVAKNPQMADLEVKGNHVFSQNSAVNLDLGGYAKGYALDRAVDYLRQQHAKHALINIGGNIIALGQHGDTPWRVGIQHPRAPGAVATVALPDGWAIGTSGDYQRYFMQAGKRYCHILDPRTGWPVKHTQSVTVLVPPQPHAGTLSDVVSKPVFIQNAQRQQMAKKFGVDELMVIDANGEMFVSPKLKSHLYWLISDVNAKTTH